MGQYIVDFYCAEAKLVIEVDGEIHHDTTVRQQDAVRQEALERERGLRFLRLTNTEVLTRSPEALHKQIFAFLNAKLPSSSEVRTTWEERPGEMAK